jgi:arylsulfatase A-like enzyme
MLLKNYSMKRNKYLLIILNIIFVFALKASNIQNNVKTKPNILVILIDDAGYADFGFNGCKDLQTPEIDKLAKRGTVFTDAHVTASVCAPSRAGLITGRYQQRTGFESNGTGNEGGDDIGLSDQAITMGSLFKGHGYKTIAIGKWHLGSNQDDHPNNRGFDEFYGFIGGSRSYFPLEKETALNRIQLNGNYVDFTGYLTDALGSKSAEYIRETNQPFLMYLAFNAVHTPMHAKVEDLDRFAGHPRQKLAAMTWSLDQNIGKVINALEESGKLDNTLVFFLSDNGGAHENSSTHGAFKGWKGNEFEGGHRVPFVMSWPDGKVAQGQYFDGLTSSLDIFATSAVAANIKTKKLRLDGVDLVPYVNGEKKGNPHEYLFWRKLDKSAIRMNDYKVVALDGFGSGLYNLKKDLSEQDNLIQKETSIYKKMISKYRQWEKGLIKPLWVEGQEWESIAYHIHEYLIKGLVPNYRDPWEKKAYLEKTKKSN